MMYKSEQHKNSLHFNFHYLLLKNRHQLEALVDKLMLLSLCSHKLTQLNSSASEYFHSLVEAMPSFSIICGIELLMEEVCSLCCNL